MKIEKIKEMIEIYKNNDLKIFPLPKGSKKAVKSWTNKKSETNNPEDYINHNLAVKVGPRSGIIIIDVDGVNAWNELSKIGIYYKDLKMFPHVSTGRKNSYHFYFKYINGIKMSNRINVVDGVDIKGLNSYVVAPPSISPNGIEYLWIVKPEDSIEGKISDMPQNIFDLLILPTIPKTIVPEIERGL